jgi:hypothetical protein
MAINNMTYQNGKIYCIRNTIDDDIYVGSTTQLLCKRMAEHRNKLKYKPHYKLYMKMAEIGLDKFYIELIENSPCENKEELRKREGFVIREMGTLNSCIAGRSQVEYVIENKINIQAHKKQYYETNKDVISITNKEYRDTHKEKRNAQTKEHYDTNKDKILLHRKEYYNNNKDLFVERNKIYRDNHKGESSEYLKIYREKNKELIKSQRSKTMTCECGRQIACCYKNKHIMSDIHQQLMNELSLNSSETLND